ncbi:hypothetical protein [Evansella tamaricis]|uniref:Uncharacterized protein n=1 Tax=Evansella tamaricis TaxID=2069301 RepID=A0ABS6JCP6_9BACI|nr:hypothetical protein [Evansella tamaricis]MBU9711288.1 hypothetical protein [Evansella tamaricis]
MGYCPLCNGMEQLAIPCKICENTMEDKGRYFDFFGDYSPYEPIELMKESDMIEGDKTNGECPHLFTCSNCQSDQVILVKEIE